MGAKLRGETHPRLDRSDVLLVVGQFDREYGSLLTPLRRVKLVDMFYDALVAGKDPSPMQLRRMIERVTDQRPTQSYAAELARRLARAARGRL